MYSEDDINYAFEATRVLHEPDRRIDTFGSTSFEFTLITELMDVVNQVRVREGRINAEKPAILRPDAGDFSFDGFGEQAEAFSEWLSDHAHEFAFLKYGFNFSRTDISESIVHESFEAVSDKVLAKAKADGKPLTAVISGIDDTWEISLLRFTLQMIESSQETNHFDFKRRGLL